MQYIKLFQQESRQLHHRRVNSILLIGMGGMLSFAVLDYILVPEYFFEFLLYRLFAIVFGGLLLLANYHDQEQRRTWVIGFSGYISAGLVILLTMHRMGGSTSSYYVGLIVAMTIYTALAPLTIVQTLISGFALVCMYLASIIFVDSLTAYQRMSLFSNLFFMVCFVFIAATQSWVDTAARVRECLLRTAEKEAADDLTRQAETLEKEVRRRVEEQRVSEKRYRLLYEAIADDVVLVTQQGTILQANSSYFSHFCRGKRRPAGSFFDAVRPEDRETVQAALRDVVGRGMPASVWPWTLLANEGQPLEVEISSVLLRRADKIIGLQLVIRDISIRKQLEKELITSLGKVKQTENAAILALAKLSEYRDITPGHHLERIREYCKVLAVELSSRSEFQAKITPEYILNLYQGVILHDIGKVAIADGILMKGDSLTAQEEAIVHNHTITGGDVIKAMEDEARGSGFLSLAKNIAYFHHERWDGKGYPYGLKGIKIPLEARIMTLADVYEDVTASINGKKKMTHQQAVDWIVGNAGHQLDPKIVDAFVSRTEVFDQIRGNLAETG